MIRSIAVTNHHELKVNSQLTELMSEEISWFWVDFSHPTEAEIEELDKTFHFHPLAIEDCIHKLQRPKLDYYEDYSFYVIHSLNQKDITKEEINFFLGKNFIVSFHHLQSNEIQDVWERLMQSNKLHKWDQYLVMYYIMDKIVDNYFPIIYQLEDELDQIENNSNRLSMEGLLDRLFDIRQDLLKFRHTIIPMRDLLYRLINSHRLKEIRGRYEYFADIHDHLLKLTEMTEANRELTNDIRDSYLSINSHQTNKVMKVLTVLTTIFMPLTFIAGVYGMNFEYMPELTWKFGYFLILSIMLVLGLGMYLWFKKKGWFD